jgi:hypothetical protein
MPAIQELESTAIYLEVAVNTLNLLHESFSDEVRCLKESELAGMDFAVPRLEMFDHALSLVLSELRRIQMEADKKFNELYEEKQKSLEVKNE